MQKQTSAVLVLNQAEPFQGLEEALKARPVKLRRAKSCAQAKRLLERPNPPQLVFTAENLPDGTWADVLEATAKAKQPVNVIVVGRVVDTRFYVEVMENGAFDFIVPPFDPEDLNHVLGCAIDNVTGRREALATKQGQYAFRPALLPNRPRLT